MILVSKEEKNSIQAFVSADSRRRSIHPSFALGRSGATRPQEVSPIRDLHRNQFQEPSRQIRRPFSLPDIPR